MPRIGTLGAAGSRGFGRFGGTSLFPFTSFTFLPIVSSGSPTGPTLGQMQTAYSGQPWISSYFTLGSYQGYQRWTVPSTGNYTITAGGAAGGDGTAVYATSISKVYGAQISGIFSLVSGQVLEMVIGSSGGASGGPHGNENGGGGGTFIYNVTTSTLLLVAGGAGGSPSGSYGTYCTRSTSNGQGQSGNTPGGGLCYSSPGYPTNGYGGLTAGSYMGGAGGGYLGSGSNGGTHCSTAYGGGYYGNGLVGGAGNSCYNSNNAGGFGGGGGGMLGTPGGGGGYTGGCVSGAWSSYSDYGGGGGSYNVGSSQTNTAGGNTGTSGGYSGAGFCTITKN